MSDNNFMLTIKLKQHTPIIHFQYDQEGATLRASELKPKLDKYLIKHAFNNEKEQYKNFQVGGKTGKHPALDYKLKIEVLDRDKYKYEKKIPEKNKDVPMFFANMGKEYEKNLKGLVLNKNVNLKIFCFHNSLISKIKSHIVDFFRVTNFGMRQSKGYGCFYIDPEDDLYTPISGSGLKFTLDDNDWRNVMQKVELFYKLMRSGINDKGPSKVEKKGNKIYVTEHPSTSYCKALIFWYAKEKLKKQWDKRTIKEHYFSEPYYTRRLRSYKEKQKYERMFEAFYSEIMEPGLETQLKTYEKISSNEDPLRYSKIEADGQYLLIRDVFGLSTSQAWRSYDSTIEKIHGKREGKNRIKARKVKDPNSIVRMKSPLTIKPIKEENSYAIHIFSSPLPDKIKEEPFIIRASNNRQKRQLELYFPKDFSFEDFFNFIKDKKNLDIEEYFSKKDEKIYPIIKNIFDQIQSTQ